MIWWHEVRGSAFAFIAVAVAWALGGCASSANGQDSGAPADAISDQVSADVTRDTRAVDSSDSFPVDPLDATDATDATDVPRDAPPVGTCDTSPITEVASRQSVRFVFPTTLTGYVVTNGFGCGAYDIQSPADGGAGGVTLGIGFQCICECPAPPPPGAQQLIAPSMAPGEVALVWDARSLVTCTRYIDCATRGWPGQGYQAETEGVMQPVGPGRYRATFSVYAALPSPCMAGTDGAASCPPLFMQGPPGFYPPYGLCTQPGGPAQISVEFDLPASGNVVVMVPGA